MVGGKPSFRGKEAMFPAEGLTVEVVPPGASLSGGSIRKGLKWQV